MRTVTGGRIGWVLVAAVAAILASPGCKTAPPEDDGDAEPVEPTGPHAALLKLFPQGADVADWELTAPIALYGPEARPEENLEPLSADLGADAVLYAGYEYVKSGTAVYDRGEAGEALTLRIFEMASPSEAFGLFSVRSGGTQFPVMGLAARMAETSLGFVKDRYYVAVQYTGLRDAAPVLRLFGHTVADGITSRGYPPAILQNFPLGSVQGERYYLHTYRTLASLPFVPNSDPERLEDALDLGPDTEMAVMGYPTTRLGVLNYLFAIRYPMPDAAGRAHVKYRAYLDASTDAAEKNVATAVVGGTFLVGTFNAEENSIRDRLSELVENLGG